MRFFLILLSYFAALLVLGHKSSERRLNIARSFRWRRLVQGILTKGRNQPLSDLLDLLLRILVERLIREWLPRESRCAVTETSSSARGFAESLCSYYSLQLSEFTTIVSVFHSGDNFLSCEFLHVVVQISSCLFLCPCP